MFNININYFPRRKESAMKQPAMKQPDKWRETIDLFSLSFTNFHLKEILGYPHAGKDVFYVRGTEKQGKKL